MSKDWDSYLCEIDGKPASVFVDMGIAEDVPLQRLPVLAWVQLPLRSPTADGLADEAESATLQAIEQALKAYRAGQRKNPVMAGMATALTDADIEALARYYSSQRPSLWSTDEIRKAGKCPGT